jgi:alkylation response protein AidB-like acyl-CoA dehydrogenase
VLVRIHGRRGVDADLPLERWLREAGVERIEGGLPGVRRETTARDPPKGYERPDPLPH